MIEFPFVPDEIIAYKQEQVARLQAVTPLPGLRALAKMQARPQDLSSHLLENRVALLARVMNPAVDLGQSAAGAAPYDPVALARRLARHGAQALVVATDERYHAGAIEHLTLVANAVNVPVIRYDFIIDEYQVVETRAAGGDGLFLTPALLPPEQVRRLLSITQRNLMTAIVCVHSEAELRAILPFEPRVIAINNYNPLTDRVDLSLTPRLVEMVPGHVTLLTMGGLESPRDVGQVMAGVDGVLVGPAMLLIADWAAELWEMLKTPGPGPVPPESEPPRQI
ncbi:MAG: hypothetical protein HPY64_14090 [Anaerolineae bacterium]|nr:hypothetical protein [Anaerolineae bacterium]